MSDFGERIEPAGVRLVRTLPGPIERVWSYLVDSKLRGTWLARGELEPRVGGKITLFFHHRELTSHDEKTPERWKAIEHGETIHGQVLRFEPPRVLAFTSGESEVTFELEPIGTGADVRLTISDVKLPTKAEQIGTAAGWHAHLGVLDERLRGAEPAPFWPRLVRYQEEYEKRFGE
jgi:uncharacterized protein YndB with AHSA1/START domain